MSVSLLSSSTSFEQGMFVASQSQNSLPKISAEDMNKIEEKSQDFEAVFLSEMMSYMFDGVETGPFNGGYGEEVFKSMVIGEYGKQMASAGGIGIAASIKDEMIRIQEQNYTNEGVG